MAALVDAMRHGGLEAVPACVVAPSADSPALERARQLEVVTAVVPYSPDATYGERLLEALNGCDILCLAGYLRLLPTAVLEAFPGRVLNIHPALLPKFGGKGMYGMNVHTAVIAANERESGCTVHLVTPVYDEGEILVQLRCPVEANDTPETLAARVLQLEHQAYPLALQKLIHGLS